MRVMGEGIADLFMRPYNFKVGAQPGGAGFEYCLQVRLPGMPCMGHSAATDCRCILLESPSMQCAGLSCKRRPCLPMLPDAVSIFLQVWAVPSKDMQCKWLGEHVATVDIDRAISNVSINKEDAG